MGHFIRYLFRGPAARFLLGVIAIPTFRLFLRKVVRLQDLDKELEKDLEQWFRASLILLAATKNMEDLLFGWLLNLFPVQTVHKVGEKGAEVGQAIAEKGAEVGQALAEKGAELGQTLVEKGAEVEQAMAESGTTGSKLDWFVLAGRILLALGVIETMPDQELFSIIHPGPPKVKFRRGQILQTIAEVWRPFLKGLICQHVNRTAPVWAILATIFGGTVGWVFFLMAITQYLIMGLVTSRDHAMDVLGEFDRQVKLRRRELMEEFDLEDTKQDADDTSAKADSEEAEAKEEPDKPSLEPVPESPPDHS